MQNCQRWDRIREITGYVGVLLLLLSLAVMAFLAIQEQARSEMLRDQAEATARP